MINVTNRLFDVLLFDQQGRRLYLTDEERKAFLNAASKAPREVRSFCSTLHYTGCRISEALALTPKSIDLSGKVIVSESHKKLSLSGGNNSANERVSAAFETKAKASSI